MMNEGDPVSGAAAPGSDHPPTNDSNINLPSNSATAPPFPEWGILPKQETQADSFLLHNPSCDGRGVVVAIFDTGTDIAAPGLKTTTEGKVKVIDAVDCSGSGDIDTSTIVTTDKKTITGLSGRNLIIPASFNNPTHAWHLGIKRAYELFPDSLVSRVKRERKQKFDQRQRTLESTLYSLIHNNNNNKCHTDSSNNIADKADRELQYTEIKALGKSYEDPGPIYDIVVWHDGSDWVSVVDTTETGQLSNCPPLHSYHKHYEYGTFSGLDLMHYTVNLYNEGDLCEIVVQAGAHGTHVAGIVAAHFPEQPEMNGIAPGAQLVSVKIGDSRLGSMETGTGLIRGLIYALAKKVDLINMSYGEATSVPNQGRFTELVSDIVNKYGITFVSSAGNAGPALSTAGAPGATTTEVIGVGAFVSPSMMLAEYSLRKSLEATQYTWSSRGPAADGSVGVCISACGAAITSVPTWTLQGVQLMNGTSMSSPAACGGIALLISAAKQHSVPYSPHRLRKALENTAKHIPTLDRLTQGCGLLQIESAYQYLTLYANYADLDILYRITVTGGGRGIYLREPYEINKDMECNITIEPQFYEQEENGAATEGDIETPAEGLMQERAMSPSDKAADEQKAQIDTTEEGQTDASTSTDTSATTTNASVPTSISTSTSTAASVPQSKSYHRNLSKVDYQLRLALINTATHCVDAPSHLLLMHGGRSFNISIHPQLLPPGLHFSEIQAIDSQQPDRGILFRIPITIVVPESIQPATLLSSASSSFSSSSTAAAAPLFPLPTPGIEYRFNGMSFTPGHIVRKFLLIPEGATCVDFLLHAHRIDTVRSFIFHCVFLLPDTPYRDYELNKHFSMSNEEELHYSMDVVGGRTLEVCLAQYWNVGGDCDMDLSVQFHGITVDHGQLTSIICWDGSMPIQRMDVTAPLRTECIAPTITLKSLQQPLRPSSAVLSTLSPTRDQLPHGRQCYQMVFTYNYECKEDSLKIIPRFPLLQNVLYEAVYEARFFMFFDSHKRLYGSGDAWPKEVTVRKGRYVLRLQVRHDDCGMLDKLKDMICVIESNLIKPVELNAYASLNAALQVNGSRFGDKRVLKHGVRKPVFFTLPEFKSLAPTYAKPGDNLLGTLSVLKCGNPATVSAANAAATGGDKRSGIELKVSVPPAPASATTSACSTTTTTATSSSPVPVDKKPVEVKKPVKDVDKEKVDRVDKLIHPDNKDKDNKDKEVMVPVPITKDKVKPEEENKDKKDKEKERDDDDKPVMIESDPDHDNDDVREDKKKDNEEEAIENQEQEPEPEPLPEASPSPPKKERQAKDTEADNNSTAPATSITSPTTTTTATATPAALVNESIAVTLGLYAGKTTATLTTGIPAAATTDNKQRDDTTTSPAATSAPASLVAATTTPSTSPPDTDADIASDLRDVQINYVLNLTELQKKQRAYEQLSPALLRAYPTYLPLLILQVEVLYDSYLRTLPTLTETSAIAAALSSLCAACDSVMTQLDPTAIAAHFGRILPKDADRATQQGRKDMETHRDRLINIINIKIECIHETLLYLSPATTSTTMTAADAELHSSLVTQFDDVYADMSSWIDLSTKDNRRKYAALIAFHDTLHQHWGAALRALNTHITEAAVGEVTLDIYEQRVQVLRSIIQSIPISSTSTPAAQSHSLIQHLIDAEQSWNIIRFPKHYTLF